MTASSSTERIDRVAHLLDARIGLKPDTAFRPQLARALRDVASARGCDEATLVQRLGADATMLDELLDRITVQETAFFRHAEQFDALRTILPTLTPPVRA